MVTLLLFGVTDMIRSFGDKRTEKAFHKQFVKQIPPDLAKRIYLKLVALDTALSINDLRTPPGNLLELLGGFNAPRYSIRVNDQWHICFTWDADAHEATDVVFEDYH